MMQRRVRVFFTRSPHRPNESFALFSERPRKRKDSRTRRHPENAVQSVESLSSSASLLTECDQEGALRREWLQRTLARSPAISQYLLTDVQRCADALTGHSRDICVSSGVSANESLFRTIASLPSHEAAINLASAHTPRGDVRALKALLQNDAVVGFASDEALVQMLLADNAVLQHCTFETVDRWVEVVLQRQQRTPQSLLLCWRALRDVMASQPLLKEPLIECFLVRSSEVRRSIKRDPRWINSSKSLARDVVEVSREAKEHTRSSSRLGNVVHTLSELIALDETNVSALDECTQRLCQAVLELRSREATDSVCWLMASNLCGGKVKRALEITVAEAVSEVRGGVHLSRAAQLLPSWLHYLVVLDQAAEAAFLLEACFRERLLSMLLQDHQSLVDALSAATNAVFSSPPSPCDGDDNNREPRWKCVFDFALRCILLLLRDDGTLLGRVAAATIVEAVKHIVALPPSNSVAELAAMYMIGPARRFIAAEVCWPLQAEMRHHLLTVECAILGLEIHCNAPSLTDPSYRRTRHDMVVASLEGISPVGSIDNGDGILLAVVSEILFLDSLTRPVEEALSASTTIKEILIRLQQREASGLTDATSTSTGGVIAFEYVCAIVHSKDPLFLRALHSKVIAYVSHMARCGLVTSCRDVVLLMDRAQATVESMIEATMKALLRPSLVHRSSQVDVAECYRRVQLLWRCLCCTPRYESVVWRVLDKWFIADENHANEISPLSGSSTWLRLALELQSREHGKPVWETALSVLHRSGSQRHALLSIVRCALDKIGGVSPDSKVTIGLSFVDDVHTNRQRSHVYQAVVAGRSWRPDREMKELAYASWQQAVGLLATAIDSHASTQQDAAYRLRVLRSPAVNSTLWTLARSNIAPPPLDILQRIVARMAANHNVFVHSDVQKAIPALSPLPIGHSVSELSSLLMQQRPRWQEAVRLVAAHSNEIVNQYCRDRHLKGLYGEVLRLVATAESWYGAAALISKYADLNAQPDARPPIAISRSTCHSAVATLCGSHRWAEVLSFLSMQLRHAKQHTSRHVSPFLPFPGAALTSAMFLWGLRCCRNAHRWDNALRVFHALYGEATNANCAPPSLPSSSDGGGAPALVAVEFAHIAELLACLLRTGAPLASLHVLVEQLRVNDDAPNNSPSKHLRALITMITTTTRNAATSDCTTALVPPTIHFSVGQKAKDEEERGSESQEALETFLAVLENTNDSMSRGPLWEESMTVFSAAVQARGAEAVSARCCSSLHNVLHRSKQWLLALELFRLQRRVSGGGTHAIASRSIFTLLASLCQQPSAWALCLRIVQSGQRGSHSNPLLANRGIVDRTAHALIVHASQWEVALKVWALSPYCTPNRHTQELIMECGVAPLPLRLSCFDSLARDGKNFPVALSHASAAKSVFPLAEALLHSDDAQHGEGLRVLRQGVRLCDELRRSRNRFSETFDAANLRMMRRVYLECAIDDFCRRGTSAVEVHFRRQQEARDLLHELRQEWKASCNSAAPPFSVSRRTLANFAFVYRNVLGEHVHAETILKWRDETLSSR